MKLKIFHDELTSSGLKPVTYWMYNEVSEAIKYFYRKKAVAFQLVPSHIHRRNIAEQAIHTWKNNFITGP